MVIVEENGIELWMDGMLCIPSDPTSEQRMVYLFEDYVIKIDTNLEDAEEFGQQTASEISRWEEMLDEDKKHFAEILDYGYTAQGRAWYKQVRYYAEEITEAVLEKMEIITNRYNLTDVYYYGKATNFVAHQGKPIIYDWAV